MIRAMNLLPVALLLGSCLVTACSRVDAVSHYGIEATLVDKTSGQVIAKRPVRVSVDGKEFDRVSDRRGKVEIPAVKYGYWTWLGGPMHWSNHKAEIAIQVPGFQSWTTRWNRVSAVPSFPEKRGAIDLGKVNLQSR